MAERYTHFSLLIKPGQQTATRETDIDNEHMSVVREANRVTVEAAGQRMALNTTDATDLVTLLAAVGFTLPLRYSGGVH